jgi:hypothetical protein
VGHQTMAVDLKLVPLGFTAEDWMVVEDQAGLALAGLLLKNQRRGQAADTTSDHDAIVDFCCVDDVRGKSFENTIANLMPGFEDPSGVAVGGGVIADATVLPAALAHRLEGDAEVSKRLPEASSVAFRKSRRVIPCSIPRDLSAREFSRD